MRTSKVRYLLFFHLNRRNWVDSYYKNARIMCSNAAINVMFKGGSRDRVGNVDFDQKQKSGVKLSNLWAKISI